MRRRILRVADKYWNSVLDRLFPFKTAKVDGLEFRYRRRDWPPHNPRDFDLGIEFHDKIDFLSGEAAIDVGANIGSYTLPLARRFHEVTSFEPNHTYCKILRLNIVLNNLRNVHVYEVALSDQAGVMPLYNRHGGSTSLDSSLYGLRYQRVSYVQTARLDDFRSRFDTLDFIKLDAEGQEYRILQGGAQLISSLKPIVAMEVHRALVHLDGSCSCDVCNRLSDLGYNLKVTGASSSVGDVHWVWAMPDSGEV
jgi:FkbM family methyltransferase